LVNIAIKLPKKFFKQITLLLFLKLNIITFGILQINNLVTITDVNKLENTPLKKIT
jgi:hypothetical protein